MEGLIRWHIFVDGNKRIELLATYLYLINNNMLMAILVDSVKFTVQIERAEEQNLQELIKTITECLTTTI